MKIVKKIIKLNKWLFESNFCKTSIPTHIVYLWIHVGEESNKSNFFTEIEKIA
jgi:hypothetical protein